MPENSPQPPELRAGEVGDRQIDTGNVELITLHFERTFGQPAPKDPDSDEPDANITFEFRTGRVAADSVMVALKVEVLGAPIATIKAAARTTLTVNALEGAPSVETEELAEIAARMGPVVIYPYLREVVADVTRRSGLDPLTLPIYQIGTFFKVDPKDLQLPEAPKASAKPKKPGKKPAKKAAKATSKKS